MPQRNHAAGVPEMEAAEVLPDGFRVARHAVNQPLSFAPFETKVLDIGQLLAGIGASPAAVSEGGITIQQIGPNPALMASGKIVDPATGFSSTIEFPEPERQLASALHSTGLPIGTPTKDSPYAGAGTFIPHVVVRNLSGATQTVTITLEYPQAPSSGGSGGAGQSASQPASQIATGSHDLTKAARALLPGGISNHPEWGAGTGATTASKTVLAYMPIGPYSTEDFPLALSELPLPLPFCSVRIQYSGTPGSMQAQVSSVEEHNNLIVDATPQNEGDGWAGSGANPWHIDQNTESVLFLTNMGDKPSRIAFEITANNVHYYLTQLVLSPHETRAIDLRALRDAQTPDLKGDRIPADATDGSVNWVRADLVPVTGRVVVINRNDGTASSFDCCTANCPNSDESMYFSNATANITIGYNNFQLTPIIQDSDCNYNQYYIDSGYNDCTWSDSNTGVATVDSTGWLTGVADGTTTIEMFANGIQYDCSNYACVSTQVQLDASSLTTVGAYPVNFQQTDGYNAGGGRLHFDYTWSSSTGNLSDLSQCTVNEIVTYPGEANPYYWPTPPWSQGTPNPTVGGISGTYGASQDDHYTGDFASPPYAAANFTAEQEYTYSCSNGALKGTLWGPLNITRSVSENGNGTFTYTGIKSGVSASCSVPNCTQSP